MADNDRPPATARELRVQTLGRFVVWRGEDQLSEGDWGREKARRLFQYFITYRRQQIAKERIAGELWPQLDAGRSDRDFKVALNALQQALEPDRPARSSSAYIVKSGLSYGLMKLDGLIDLDVVHFERDIAAGSATEKHAPGHAIKCYRQALSWYQGEYLPDAIYEDWSSAERERLLALYLAGASRLARLLLAEGELIETIDWSQRVLAVDGCWEEAYRLLMLAHMASGNRPLAIRAYQQCRQTLLNELGIEPMRETTRLFEQISHGAAG